MKKILLIIFAILICGLANAQIRIGKSAYQMMMEKALSGAMCIVEQEYQLCDTISGNLFGKNNKPQFNTVNSLAVVANGTLILNERAINPSKFDSDFEKYKEKYRAVCSITRFHLWGDSINYIYKKESLPDSIIGLDICDTVTTENGWIVFVTQPSNGKDYEISIYNKNYSCNSDTLIETSEWDSHDILGGFYIKTSYPSSGSIIFKLCGVLMSEKQGKWLLTPIKKKNYINHKNNITTDDILTPINDKSDVSKRKKKKIRNEHN